MKMNEAIIIMANHHLQTKLNSFLQEIIGGCWVESLRARWFKDETNLGAIFNKMCTFGYDPAIIVRPYMRDLSNNFILPDEQAFIDLVKQFTLETDPEQSFEKMTVYYKKLSDNVVDWIIDWMYEWIETVAYAYHPEKWSLYQEMAESLDAPIDKVISGEAEVEFNELILKEMMFEE